jgi:hypothetical protein
MRMREYMYTLLGWAQCASQIDICVWRVPDLVPEIDICMFECLHKACCAQETYMKGVCVFLRRMSIPYLSVLSTCHRLMRDIHTHTPPQLEKDTYMPYLSGLSACHGSISPFTNKILVAFKWSPPYFCTRVYLFMFAYISVVCIANIFAFTDWSKNNKLLCSTHEKRTSRKKKHLYLQQYEQNYCCHVHADSIFRSVMMPILYLSMHAYIYTYTYTIL